MNTKIVYADSGKKRMETGNHFKNGASSKSLMSRGNLLRKACFALLVTNIVFFVGCESNTEIVKNSILADVDYSISIGDALDNYKYFTNTEWREFKTSQGREVVEFKGQYFKNDVIVRIQFRLNKDLEEDDEGVNLRVGYQCYSYVTYDGEKREHKDSELINKLYKNREIQVLSNENLRKY